MNNELGLSPVAAANARHLIVAWLECDDCKHGELVAVAKLGFIAVPTLSTVLSAGPSPAKMDWLREKLTDNYEAMAAYFQARPTPRQISMSKEEYVEHYLRNYILRNRVRAALALGEIGGNDARTVLKNALLAEKIEEVRKAIDYALKRLG